MPILYRTKAFATGGRAGHGADGGAGAMRLDIGDAARVAIEPRTDLSDQLGLRLAIEHSSPALPRSGSSWARMAAAS